MDEQDVKTLLEKYNAGQCTAEEKALLETWYLEHNQDIPHGLSGEQLEQATGRIWARLEQQSAGSRIIPFLRYAAAASVVIALGVGAYFLARKEPPKQLAQNQADIAPGGNKAILTLSNGKKIILDGKKGQVASQAGRQVLVGETGEITYAGQSASSETIYNTLTVPIGNRRDLVLPDGSKVSLDAGSSITYPVVFASERKVSMTGQAYFTVKHDVAHPFYTMVKGVTITDIGTEFNINAYDDEPALKTTLIQGSIKVNNLTLKPGEQAASKGNSTTLNAADPEAVTAWKDNDFYFSNESLKSSMRQIARWYNVSIVYNKVDERLKIFVDVTRSTNLSVVLKAIENTGKVKCRLDGHTITLSQPDN